MGGVGARYEWARERERGKVTLHRSPFELTAFAPTRYLHSALGAIFRTPQVRRAPARESRQDLAGSSAKRCPVQLRGAWGTSFSGGRGGRTAEAVRLPTVSHTDLPPLPSLRPYRHGPRPRPQIPPPHLRRPAGAGSCRA